VGRWRKLSSRAGRIRTGQLERVRGGLVPHVVRGVRGRVWRAVARLALAHSRAAAACGSQAGSWLRLIDFVYRSTLRLIDFVYRSSAESAGVFEGQLHVWHSHILVLLRPGLGFRVEAHKLCVSLKSRLESNKEEEGGTSSCTSGTRTFSCCCGLRGGLVFKAHTLLYHSTLGLSCCSLRATSLHSHSAANLEQIRQSRRDSGVDFHVQVLKIF